MIKFFTIAACAVLIAALMLPYLLFAAGKYALHGCNYVFTGMQMLYIALLFGLGYLCYWVLQDFFDALIEIENHTHE